MFYDDDTPLWGRIAGFRSGSHDWAKAETIFYPTKPVKRIEVYVFLRKAAGTAWF